MAKGIAFDTYKPDQRDLREAARNAPGPQTNECEECGAPAHFGEGVSILRGIPGSWFCGKHCAPEFRRKRP